MIMRGDFDTSSPLRDFFKFFFYLKTKDKEKKANKKEKKEGKKQENN